MSHILSLGAFNVDTNDYVHPRFANKKDKYKCPDCGKELILVQGNIRIHHFRHKKDSVNPCNHYSNPTESQIHKDAKRLIKSLLERKIPISFNRKCVCCEKVENHEIPEISENSGIQEEWSFDYNGLKIADVAYLEDGERFCLFEIYHTHKTRSEDRPEPWFEINAETLIQMVNDNNNSITSLVIPCVRVEKCEVCIEKEEANRIERMRELEVLGEEKRMREEAKRMREEELKMILFQKEEVEKQRKDEKRKKYEERKNEKRERESMSNEEIFKITEKAKLLREERNANFDTIKLEHFKKILEKERKQKEKRRLRELNKEKIRENLANK